MGSILLLATMCDYCKGTVYSLIGQPWVAQAVSPGTGRGVAGETSLCSLTRAALNGPHGGGGARRGG